MTNNKYFWVIGGGLLQIPLIEEVRKLNLKIIVSDLSKGCACAPLADIFVNKDIFDIEGHTEEAMKIVDSGKTIVGVLAAGIDAPETMAVLAKNLGLPSVEASIAYLVHNKHLFRKRLAELGYPVPKFKEVTKENLHELAKIVDEIGFPLIVKNSDSSGSRGTKIFYKQDLDGIHAMIHEAIHVSKSKVALIEECWIGPEQTVETIFDIEGNFYPCFITDRIFDRSSGYAIELGLRHPSTLPIDLQNEMFTIAKNISMDLGIKMGAAKFDLILTEAGPRVIEMTVRLSGGFDCQYLVPAATGKNVMRAAILTALGEKFPPELLKNTKHRVGFSESIWPEPGVISQIAGVEDAKKLKGVEQIFFRQKLGDVVQPYTDCTKRVCFIIVTGKDENEARETMNKVRETMIIKTEN
jgi:biotin carboxylase